MELFTYQAEITLQKDVPLFAFQLWHFANLFPVFNFSINDNHFTDHSTIEELAKSVDVSLPNRFVLTISDHNYNYIHKAIELLDFALLTSDVSLSFVEL